VFVAGVRRALGHIEAGDVYQLNLSRAWRATAPAAVPRDVLVAALYRALRVANPAPFAALARWGGVDILSSSPERLLRVEAGVASTRPIAGTRPRGASLQQDAALAAELRNNAKERAEHVMLIDLERNDLGRVCEPGSVRVDEFMGLESYTHVHHIVSQVSGRLRPDASAVTALRALFPGGTITGCPKVRCMELIAGLESQGRGAYTGSIGMLGRDGSADFNILIRTLTLHDGELRGRAGAGIVADSDPQHELEETRAKALGLLRALDPQGQP
jgi:anthranilate synthase component 1